MVGLLGFAPRLALGVQVSECVDSNEGRIQVSTLVLCGKDFGLVRKNERKNEELCFDIRALARCNTSALRIHMGRAAHDDT